VLPYAASRVQRLALRLSFAAVVLSWSLLKGPDAGALTVPFLVVLFALYSAALSLWEKKFSLTSRMQLFFTLGDFIFAGTLIFLTGGINSDFHLLLYMIVAFNSPFATRVQTFIIPTAGTLAYTGAVLSTAGEAYWFDIALRISLLWLLAPLLKAISEKAVGERERAEKLAGELSTTHDQIRRYTAALEKANVQKEQSLDRITLLHRFGIEVFAQRKYEKVYDLVLDVAGEVSESNQVFFVHKKSAALPRKVVRFRAGPSTGLDKWVRENALKVDIEDGKFLLLELESGESYKLYRFQRLSDTGCEVVLGIVQPEGSHSMDTNQSSTLSALVDRAEMQLELIRLQMVLEESNERLQESNSHLTRLHELKNELSGAFLANSDTEKVLDKIQDILAKELFELDRLNLFMPDSNNEMLECRTSVGIGEYPVEDIRVPVDERGGAISLAYRSGETIFYNGKGPVPDQMRIAKPFSLIPAIRSRIFVVVPLIDHEGTVLGVIGADRKFTHRPISPETVAMLEFFATHVAVVLALGKRSL